jgi:hypothetical protein
MELHKSTITPSEKRAFEGLFAMKKAAAAKESGNASKKDKPTRELGLDAILDNAMQKINSADPRRNPQFPAELRPMAEEARIIRRAELDAAREPKREANVQRALNRVNALMDQAQTDRELFQILRHDVLSRVAALRLDPITTSYQTELAEMWDRRITRNVAKLRPSSVHVDDLKVMTANLPNHLLHYMELMRTKFPASQLPLLLINHLKRLGPSAFAMGASTAFYNAHMRLLCAKYPTDLHNIVEVLEEMDRGVYEQDEGTEELLIEILKDAKRLSSGQHGPGLRLLWRTERVTSGLREIARWKEVVTERRQEAVLKAVREVEVLREGGGVEEDDSSLAG